MDDYKLSVNNTVQGVQGVQGTKSTTLHSCKPRHARTCALLCRVCRVLLYTRARNTVYTSLSLRERLARIYPPCTPCTPCTRLVIRGMQLCRVFFSPLHTLHNLFIFKKMKKITCGKENLKTFTAEFKSTTPVFFDVVKEFYAKGLIPGLRGATLEFAPFSKPEAKQESKETIAMQCQQCRQWLRDAIGDGLGIGQCLINSRPDLLKWPAQTACKQFAAI